MHLTVQYKYISLNNADYCQAFPTLSGYNFAAIEFLVREIPLGDSTLINKSLDAGKRGDKCIAEILYGIADKPAFSNPPRLGNI
jgi:hypothetical protein